MRTSMREMHGPLPAFVGGMIKIHGIPSAPTFRGISHGINVYFTASDITRDSCESSFCVFQSIPFHVQDLPA